MDKNFPVTKKLIKMFPVKNNVDNAKFELTNFAVLNLRLI